jgi:lipopolysaccharide/colanic/teichoic acid biosynthesis glycosyltransferase
VALRDPMDVGSGVPAPFTLRTYTAAEAESAAYAFAKRAVDLVIGTTLLVLTLPLMAIIALVIALDSPGAPVFKQQRVGKGGKPFTFYKFRTMKVAARSEHPTLYAYEYSQDELDSMFFKLADDPRLTRFGRRLRRTSLDELPNLLCVVRGSMSLVGPRPEIPEMVRHYRPEQMPKFEVKPGLTGLAQVSGRNILTFQQTVRFDLEYVVRRTLLFDLWILLVRTPLVVVSMFGAL